MTSEGVTLFFAACVVFFALTSAALNLLGFIYLYHRSDTARRDDRSDDRQFFVYLWEQCADALSSFANQLTSHGGGEDDEDS